MGEHMQGLRQPLDGPLGDELGRLAAGLIGSGALSEQTADRMLDLIWRFGVFVTRGVEATRLDGVTVEQAAAFVRARAHDGSEPSIATMHLRRSAVRLLFRTARAMGAASGDPTVDVLLEPRTGIVGRPLTDDEVALCRTVALHSLTSTRLSSAWALAEATARTAELPHLRVADLDLDAGRVWIHGSPRTEPRWGALDDWAARQLARHLRDLGNDPDPETLLTYYGAGSAHSQQASSCQAIGETLRRAGLGAEADVRPISVAGWAGARLHAETGRIEVVARALGVRSLDRAARLIGLDWHQPVVGEP